MFDYFFETCVAAASVLDSEKLKRMKDAKRAAEDLAYCDELMKQYGIG